MKSILALGAMLLLTGCSVFGDNGVESAPYRVVLADDNTGIEVRRYESMVLVTAPMGRDGENSAFRMLFDYISGNNTSAQEIAMTAPVFTQTEDSANGKNQTSGKNESEQNHGSGQEIAMTAPVFMDNQAATMSFVMPQHFTLETTPVPNNPQLEVAKVENYQVAAITFSGRLSDANVEKHTRQLTQWLAANNYQISGSPIRAAYNGPFTLPGFRKNEVLIAIE